MSAPTDELRAAARGGVVTIVGAATSALLGFAFNILLARHFGPGAAGIVLQAIGCFLITLSVTRLGLDTAAVWLLPRLMHEERGSVVAALVALLVPATVLPLVVALAWLAGARVFRSVHGGSSALLDALDVVALCLPAASLMTVALSATRAFGGVLAFNAVGNITVPALRPLLLLLVISTGGGAVAASLSWAVPWLVGAVLSMVLLLGQARRATRGFRGSWRPDHELRSRVRRFALPRLFAALLEQSILWLDVVLVGAIMGASAAGVYGSAARFVTAGAIVTTALRIVVAPRFSALLGQGRIGDVQDLYGATARWILLFGAPAFVMLAVFAPTVLGWLGDGFEEGRAALVILCLGAMVTLAAGNVQALLLMSGRSKSTAVNKAVVLAFNVVGNLVCIPTFGIEGAATVWAASMVLDAALASWQVRRHVGVLLAGRSIATVSVVVAMLVAVPSLAITELLGQGAWQLVVALAVAAVALLTYCYLDRRRLQLDRLASLRRTPR